jgi:RNA polymerase sigma-32 factor
MHMQSDPIVARLISDAKRYSMLTVEREREVAMAWRSRQDRTALDELVGSHLRLVIKVARGFAGYGLPLADLVAEGNIGLMQAAAKFEPERGFRFATYAMWWIRAAIQEYVLRSWSLVRIGTTAAQKKLFFNLRRAKAQLAAFEQGDLAPEAVAAIAEDLQVTENAVVEMNRRLAGTDASLNAPVVSESGSELLELVPDERPDQETALGEAEEVRRHRALLGMALETLNARERTIIVAHQLRERPATFEELSQQFAVSPERIRQIEVRAIAKLARSVANVTALRRALAAA